MDLTKSIDKLSTNFLVLNKNKLPKSSLNKFNSKKKKILIVKKLNYCLFFYFHLHFL